MQRPTVPEPKVAPTSVEPLLTTAEASEMLKIGRTALWRLTRGGALPCVRIGRSVRYRPEDVRAFVARHVTTDAA